MFRVERRGVYYLATLTSCWRVCNNTSHHITLQEESSREASTQWKWSLDPLGKIALPVQLTPMGHSFEIWINREKSRASLNLCDISQGRYKVRTREWTKARTGLLVDHFARNR